jgi:SAM-dependent methyltransferase
MSDADLPGLPEGAFAKIDDGSDDQFYSVPRFVTHIDDGAIAAVTGFYRTLFPPGGRVLDLMGSWVSHLPPEIAYGEVIGHGMNADELRANKRYGRWFVQDLNADPTLPLADAGLDAVAICVSVQYLQHPVAVFRAVRRALKPGGVVAITFSNRCFPTKAVAIWRSLDDGRHAELVSLYLRHAGFATVEARTLVEGTMEQDPLWAVSGRAPGLAD